MEPASEMDRLRAALASSQAKLQEALDELESVQKHLSASTTDLTGTRAMNDVLEETQARERLAFESAKRGRAEAERLGRIKDEFLANLSHEIRTPLNAILGWAQILKPGVSSEKDLAEGLEIIVRNSRVQAKLIDDLLDMSRIISGKMRLDVQRVDLPAVIDAAIESVSPAAKAKGIKLQKVVDPIAGPVTGDPGRLQQVVWNLLSNAVKFTPRKGKVQVVVERSNSHVELSVSDTGKGIAPDYLRHVFERLVKPTPRQPKGTAGWGMIGSARKRRIPPERLIHTLYVSRP